MIKFNEVSFEEFKELVQFLKFNDDDYEFHNITKRLTRFIKDMTAIQSVEIDNIVKEILNEGNLNEKDVKNSRNLSERDVKEKDVDEAKTLFILFQNKYTDLDFDPEGRLDITEFDYSEISLQTCEMMYEQSKSRIENNFGSNIDEQVVEAKELNKLLKMDGRFEYYLKKGLYFKSDKVRPLDKDELKNAEDIVKDLFPNGNVLGKFIHFIYNQKYEKCYIFVEHFLHRLDTLSKDKELKHPLNREFYEKLSKL